MIKVNAHVLQLVKHHDCGIYFRYSITRAHTYVIMILCVPVATHGHLTSYLVVYICNSLTDSEIQP